MHEFARDGSGHRLPSLLSHPARHLLRTFALGTLSAETDEHEPRLQDVEIAALEVAGGGVAPDRDVVVVVEADGGHVVGTPALELHVADECSPGGHGAGVAGKEIAVQGFVGVQIMARDSVGLVDRDHFGVLRHGRLEVERDSGVLLVVQGAHRDRTRIDPAVERGRAEEHVPERSVVVGDAPPARLGMGSGHRQFVLDSDRPVSTPPLGQSVPEREAGRTADGPRAASRGGSATAGHPLESRPRRGGRSRTIPGIRPRRGRRSRTIPKGRPRSG